MDDGIKRIFLRRLEGSAETSRPPGVIRYEEQGAPVMVTGSPDGGSERGGAVQAPRSVLPPLQGRKTPSLRSPLLKRFPLLLGEIHPDPLSLWERVRVRGESSPPPSLRHGRGGHYQPLNVFPSPFWRDADAAIRSSPLAGRWEGTEVICSWRRCGRMT